MNWKSHLEPLPRTLTILSIALALKYHYSTASVNDLRWILAPTAWLVEVVTGSVFTFESHAGYMSSDNTFLIAASCSGVNFLIIAFLVMTLGKIGRQEILEWSSIPAAALVAYFVTLVANTVRIVVALLTRQFDITIAGLDSDQLHRVEGIAVYFIFLLLILITGKKQFGATITRRSGYLLAIYYAVTLGFPIVRGGFLEPGFWQHAVFVLVVPLLLLIPLWVISRSTRHIIESRSAHCELASGDSCDSWCRLMMMQTANHANHPNEAQDTKQGRFS